VIDVIKATVSGNWRSKGVPMRSVLLPAVALVGCTASSEQVRPPPDAVFFPTGAAISPDERFLFVANANSELRYDSGTIGVIDLNEVDRVATEWMSTGGSSVPGCEKDPDHRETLYCGPKQREDDPEPEAHFMIADASARIGNFATDIAVQDTGAGTLRLIVPTRGDPSIAWVDFDGSRLNCNDGAQGFALCDEGHRLAYVHNDPDLALVPDEPFDAYADSNGQFAVVSHLTTGAVTLINSPIDGDATVADVMSGLFAADPVSGVRGATGIAARQSASSDGSMIYVASRSEDRVQTLTVGRPVNGADPYLLAGNYFFLNLVGATAGSSSDSRGLAFSANGDRMYVLNRKPPSLQVYDTSPGPTGYPKNQGIAATDICRQASTLTIMDTGDGDRVYVSCFQDGQVYVVDPRGLASVEQIITVGRGPYSVVAAPNRKKLYVTNFLEDTVVVLDVSPTSPYYNRVVLRIGDVRPL
jgi:DNA-binding beta-propeller fold protein YncE